VLTGVATSLSALLIFSSPVASHVMPTCGRVPVGEETLLVGPFVLHVASTKGSRNPKTVTAQTHGTPRNVIK
jgi:hypothetical protein